MNVFSKLAGSMLAFFQIGGPAGAGLSNNAGILEAKDPTNTTLAVVRGATPIGTTDFTTKSYVDAADQLLELEFRLANEPISGTTTTLTYAGRALASAVYVSVATSLPVKSVTFTMTGVLLTSIVTKVFAPDGVTIMAQTTETLSYTARVLTGDVTTRDV
jgi:hypothetical protein